MDELLEGYIGAPGVRRLILEYAMPAWRDRAGEMHAKRDMHIVFQCAMFWWLGPRGPGRNLPTLHRRPGDNLLGAVISYLPKPSSVARALKQMGSFQAFVTKRRWYCFYCQHHLRSWDDYCCPDRKQHSQHFNEQLRRALQTEEDIASFPRRPRFPAARLCNVM